MVAHALRAAARTAQATVSARHAWIHTCNMALQARKCMQWRLCKRKMCFRGWGAKGVSSAVARTLTFYSASDVAIAMYVYLMSYTNDTWIQTTCVCPGKVSFVDSLVRRGVFGASWQLFYIGSGAFPGGRKSRTKGAIAAVAALWRGPTVFDAYTT